MKKIGIYIIGVLFVLINVNSVDMNSENYNSNITSLSSGGYVNLTSSNFESIEINIPFVANELNSANYNSSIGFSHVVFEGNSSSTEEATVNEQGEIEFTDPVISQVLEKVAGLPSGAEVNTTYYAEEIPPEWEAPTTENIDVVVEEELKYFEINVNETTAGGSYTVYFNLTQGELGSASATNIRAFVFENNAWSGLPTSVINSNSDPASFSFTTTHFSRFFIGKTTSSGDTVVVSSSSSTNNNRNTIKIQLNLDIIPKSIHAKIKKGDYTQRTIYVKNTNSEEVLVNLNLNTQLKKFVLTDHDTFFLNPGEEKEIILTIFSSDNQKTETYSGFIEIKSGSFLKNIPIIVEIQDKKALFDIKIIIPEDNKYLYNYEKALAEIYLLNMGDLKPVDVKLYYAIKNLKGEVLIFKEETLAVYDEQTLKRTIDLPRNIINGDYILYSSVEYGNETATSADIIHITDEKIEIEKPYSINYRILIDLPDLNIKNKFIWIIGVFILVIFYFKHNLGPIEESDSLDSLNKDIELIDYIIKAKKARKSNGQIVKHLEKNHWSKKSIDKYLK